jgi:hypothetical protein
MSTLAVETNRYGPRAVEMLLLMMARKGEILATMADTVDLSPPPVEGNRPLLTEMFP